MSEWARCWWIIAAILAFALILGSTFLAAMGFYFALVVAVLQVFASGFRAPPPGGPPAH